MEKTEEQFYKDLIAAGVVKEIKPPRTTPLGERHLLVVKGKPVSETLIEDREYRV